MPLLAATRRRFLSGLLAASALPTWARAESGNPDVVIVGAGAAGIAAAKALAAQGLSFVLLEAKDRIGGRAFTDTASFPGLAFDHGCSWLHQADRNPFLPIAKAQGRTLQGHDDSGEAVFVGDRRATDSELTAYGRAWDAVKAKLREMGEAGLDLAPGPRLPLMLPWSHVSKSWIGPLSMGADAEDFSALDYWTLAETEPNVIVREGYGAVVAAYGADLPVRLATPVTGIRWGQGQGVTVETPAGDLAARACLVTVSTGVLAAGGLRFDPALPPAKQAAIEGLPMGLLAKVALRFDGRRFGLRPNEWLSYATKDPRLCYFLTWPFDQDLMIGFVGGRFGFELSAAGETAAIDFALGELRRIFGAEIDQHFVAGRFTPWAQDPQVLGGYAYQRPGARGARQALAEPLAERLFFAGEATAGELSMTCGGAFRSGERAAAEIVKALA